MENFNPGSKASVANSNLWSVNTPAQFWQIENEFDSTLWQKAIQKAVQICGFPINSSDIDHLLYYSLGEGRFGENHWDLSAFNRFYWMIKPIIPGTAVKRIRGVVNKLKSEKCRQSWPIEDRFVCFQWETMRQILKLSGNTSITIKNFWPDRKTFSLVLTHDVETIQKHSYISVIADLEEKNGFRSSFNLVGEQIPKNLDMYKDLVSRGFEIGIHGWQHNEIAFKSRTSFMTSALKIEECMERIGAVGLRFPLNLRNPLWMQDINIEYDLSFFDTDPFEPIPGGTMSIWPFMIGRFMELPSTLVQDNTLINQLGERTPKIWLNKIDFIKKYHGMALVNSHPDYLVDNNVWKVYEDFLKIMKDINVCWNGIPQETARWWKYRTDNNNSSNFPKSNFAEAALINDQLEIN